MLALRRALLIVVSVLLACGDDGGETTRTGSTGQATGTGGEAPGGNGATGGGGATGDGGAEGGGGAVGDGGALGEGGATGIGGATGGGGSAEGGGGSAEGGGGHAEGGGDSVGITCDAPSGSLPALVLTPIADGLVGPVFATSPPGDLQRLFILEQRGVIRVVENGALLETPFVDLQDQVHDVDTAIGDENGLLGLAFHPDYAVNGRFFVYATPQNNSAQRVVEYARLTDVMADPTPVATYTATAPGSGRHAGGTLLFEPGTTHLIVTVGEAGDPANAPNLADPRGKLLRYDVDAFSEETPVAGNVAEGYPHVWQFGFRNPYRASLDPCSGIVYVGDVGPGSLAGNYEEINQVAPGQAPSDHGWDPSGCTGLGCVDADAYPDADPMAFYDHLEGDCAVIGGYVYRGSAIPALRGRYLYADYCSRRVRTFVPDGGAASDPIELTEALGSEALELVSGIGQDGAGNLYLIDLGTTTGGAVYRIDVAP